MKTTTKTLDVKTKLTRAVFKFMTIYTIGSSLRKRKSGEFAPLYKESIDDDSILYNYFRIC